MLLLIISFLVIAVYMAAVCIKAKGVPYSISATYYTLDHKLIFGASMALTAMFLFPVIWEMSTTFTIFSAMGWLHVFLVGSYSGVAGFYRLHGNRHE